MSTASTTHPWHDTTLSAEDRANALLAELTWREKIQQLVSVWPGAEGASGDVAPMQSSQDQAASFDDAIVDGIGQITRPFGTAPIDPTDGVARLAELQHAVMNANRFHIPAVAHEECLTGFTAWQATVYPTPLAWASTFDPDLIHELGVRIGTDLASVGVHQGLAPVLDVVRDYRWGRVEETLGEDPHLVGELATAYVRGIQSAGVIATLKHFVGYSASRGARNHAPVSMGPRELADVMLLPFERAVIEGGVRSVMNAYTDIDGIPAGADRDLLTGVLRDQWGFTGTVVSDYWAVPFLASMHKIAADNTHAGRLALEAGIDIELPHALGFDERLANDSEGRRLVDQATLRVLTQKAELGLLDADWQPQNTGDRIDLDSANNHNVARQIAEKSIVLLRNDDHLVPMTNAPHRIAVIGPGADDARCLFGCYSFPNHVLPNHPDLPIGIDAPTVLDALRKEFPNSEITYVRGADHLDSSTDDVETAAQAAVAADLTILVIGDRSGMFGHGTSGEGCDVVDLRLPGGQEVLAEAVLARASQAVLVVLSGRPYAIERFAEAATATIQTFFPGQEGAAAIAGVLSGRVAPTGRLPVQVPGDNAPQPSTYLAAPLALNSDGVSNINPSPAYFFGHGLSTTIFDTSQATANTTTITTDGTVEVTVQVTNVGLRAGTAVPQLYLSDPVASVARPVRRLIGAARTALAPGESVEIVYTVSADLASFTGRDGTRQVEPGTIILTVADSAGDPGTAVEIDLTGPTRSVDHTRALSTTHAIHALVS
ncbi:glycosyl hydrolase [Cryobacterium zongtaii]|uniref:Glycosyl hydrolase n=1 Tax=Cryobacterium zongtaii TaxID=1259217 RepID=A0A2S3ZK49_9MICO|nr:glycoside hydrolase family 3 N-terminal domain-containing protein [Cryobacterium zongtaii]POH68417.1 glycosyl hydrolase [Cryobacterium zongtaii]